jgi:hypothetical protein
MRRVLANAVVLAGLLMIFCPYVLARGAHGFAGGGRGFSGGFAPLPRTRPIQPIRSAPPASTSRPRSYGSFSYPPTGGSSLINPLESQCLLNSNFAASYYCRQYFSGRASWGYEPIYPYWMPTMNYDSDQPAQQASSSGNQDSDLNAQVGNLAAEVEMMREDQAMRDSRGAPSAQPSAQPEPETPSTTLVYRDGHQMEVHDYAIQGDTLFVFSNQTTQRVPLADLDLTATARVNGQRGVDFVAPDAQ